MVFQRSNPFPKIDPRERRLRAAHRRHERRARLETRVERALGQAALWEEVKDRLDDSALGLSGGQQQRLCIARALAVEPEVLLMDEPASALDPIATAHIEELINELSAEYTVVIVTHNMQQAARVADYTAFFYLGELVEFDRTRRAVHEAEQLADGRLHHGAVRMMRRNSSSREHTNREYEGELRRLREQLLLMGAKVEDIIAGSIRALIDRDSALAEQMIAVDRKINQLEIDIDELCMQVLARRQPVASDLRFLTTALKLVTDLERIGDLGVNICERVLELNGEPPLKPYVDMPNMAREAQEMLHEALDAFVAADAERAQRVIARDRNVDAYYTQIFRELLTYMMEDPRNIFRATRLQSIAKYLERIGDHATNLGELVVFMVKGKDIRHAGKLSDGR